MLVDRLVAVFAFALLVGFLAILVWKLGRLDIGIVAGVTLLLVAWDFFGGSGHPARKR